MSLVPNQPAVPARKRIAELLDEEDPEAAVQALPATDLYALVKEIGLGDATDILALAAPEQVQACLDLDVWDGDQIRDADVRPWLFALVETGPEKLTQVWRELDPELPALLLARWCRIYQLAEEEVPDWEEPPFVPTPDRYFMLKVTAEDPDTAKLVDLLIDRLYRVDAVLARHSIRAAASEPAAQLEEQLFRWRTGRMQDLGFAPLDEALEIYQPIDLTGAPSPADAPDQPPHDARLLPVLAQPLAQAPFLSRVLARVTGDSLRLEGSLAMLLNKVLAAHRVEPSDTVGATAAAAYGAATLSLGLETLARGDVDQGLHTLQSSSLTRLHRVGWTIVLSLARLARALWEAQRARPVEGARPPEDRVDEEDRALVAALRAPRPRLADGRPIAQVADVKRVTSALALIGAKVTLVEALGHTGKETLGAVLRTAIVRATLGLPLSPVTISLADLQRFLRAPEIDVTPAFAALEKPLPEEFAAVISGYRRELQAMPAEADAHILDGVLLFS